METALTAWMSRLGYTNARRLLLATGLAVLGAVVLVTWARRVDSVEVIATLLFVPIFLAFVYRGVWGGLIAAAAATVVYAVARGPAIDVVGAGEFTGLITSRAAAYLIFGLVGGWSTQVLEQSLEKLELYDQVDDETGLGNARFLCQQVDLEAARAERYRTLFSVVVLDVPGEPLARLPRRKRVGALRELGRQLSGSVRNADHLAHARDGSVHRFAAVLPETGSSGAEVFAGRFADAIGGFLARRGVDVRGGTGMQVATVPGDEAEVAAVRESFREIDERQRPPVS